MSALSSRRPSRGGPRDTAALVASPRPTSRPPCRAAVPGLAAAAVAPQHRLLRPPRRIHRPITRNSRTGGELFVAARATRAAPRW